MRRLEQPLLDSPPLLRLGIPERVNAASPAVATDFSYSCEGNYFERLVSVFCRIVCDANAGNREVVLEYQDSLSQRYALAGAATVITANNTGDYFFSAYLGEDVFTVDGSALCPLAPIILQPTDKWKLHIVNVQAGDQLSRIRFVRERFYTTDQPPVSV